MMIVLRWAIDPEAKAMQCFELGTCQSRAATDQHHIRGNKGATL